MPTNFFDQTAITQLKNRLSYIQKLGPEKKVFLSLSSEDHSPDAFRAIKAVSLLEVKHSNVTLLDVGFQYKGIGKTLVVRNVCAFNWHVLSRQSTEALEQVRLTFFYLEKNSFQKSAIRSETYFLKFTDCNHTKHVEEDYVMMTA